MTLRLPGPFRGLRIGLFGGSFNPAHDGHAHVAETALERLGLDWVWWLPARGNPLKDGQENFGARMASAARLANRHPRMRVSDLEAQLATNYTLDTLCQLLPRLPGTRPVWIMGADSLAHFHRWGGWQDIALRIPIAIVARPGIGLKARRSVFARTFAGVRLPETSAGTLADRLPPAWVYLSAPWNHASSTALRARARLRNPFRTDRTSPETPKPGTEP